MRTRLRVLVLGCLSIGALVGAGSALAAFTPTLAIGHEPPTAGSAGTTSIRLVVPRDDDALARGAVYAPVGYRATLNQAVGAQIGTASAQIKVREPIPDVVIPINGTITVADPAALVRPSLDSSVSDDVLECTGTRTHSAIWLATFQASGVTLDIPIALDVAPAPISAFASYVLTVCLPNPNVAADQGGAPLGAKLVLAQLNPQGVFTAPSAGGTHRWHVLATPWPNAAGPPNVAGTVEAQGRVMLPARVTVRAASRGGRVTITGSVLEGGTGAARQAVRLRVGRRTYSVRTNAGGSFRLVVRTRRGTRLAITATANVPARPVTPCSSPSPFPGVSCVSETLQFFLVTRSITHRVR